MPTGSVRRLITALRSPTQKKDQIRTVKQFGIISRTLDECWTPSELSKKVLISEAKSLFLYALESFLCPVTFVTTAFTFAGKMCVEI